MSVLNDKNEPSRFLGEGVSFKAKLIGILEVTEARGDRMCQEALADLKMAIRAAGEHKQRISVHVAIDGLRLRDEKTGDSLYHHPVHKISFIAQDMSDSRAFGYIFGSPDTGHRFFGIKTDKAASQVVIAMRDLFQVVFELKKKEIELAKQQLEGKSITLASRYISAAALDTSKSLQNSSDGSLLTARSRIAGLSSSRTGTGDGASSSTASTSGAQGATATGSNNNNNTSGGAVAELVDLEQELSSLQRGLHQMERLTPPTDPFGDSFSASAGFLPPPPSSGRGRTSQASVASEGSSPFSPAPPPPSSASQPVRPHFTFEATSQHTSISPPPTRKYKPPPIGLLERTVSPTLLAESSQAQSETATASSGTLPTASSIFDVFTELDPLGTGRSKPYVDKKHFFQELKNPPKKVLKDLVPGLGVSQSEQTYPSKYETTSSKPELLTTLTSVGRHSGGSVSIAKSQPSSNQMFSSSSLFSSDPFAETDPFDNTDPFAESLREDPFVSGSLDFANIQPEFSMPKLNQVSKDCTLPDTKIGFDEPKIRFPSPVSCLQNETAPLQVSLPPEVKTSPKLYRNSSSDSKSSIRQRPQSAKQQQQPVPPAQPSPSPPPPLPPKKPIDKVGAERTSDPAPPLPLPARRRPTPSGSLGWLSTTEDDYLTPIPPAPRRPVPSPTPSPGLDLTLAALLTCEMDELAGRLKIPVDELSKMTVAQLTSHLHKYIQASGSTVSDITNKKEKDPPVVEDKPPEVAERPAHTLESKVEFEANFEDNFTSANSDTFVANFDNASFSNTTKTNNPSYDRYAVFREIEVDEFKSLPDASAPNQEEPDSLSSQPDLPSDPLPTQTTTETKPFSEFNIESLTVSSPSIKLNPQHSKLEELKSVISNLHKSSLSPTPDIDITAAADDAKTTDNEVAKTCQSSSADRYAALRDLSTNASPRPLSADLPDEPVLSSPLQVPKERKRSDEKSDGFDHSDFFDCIDNSLSIATADDAFRKSPLINKPSDMLKSPVPSLEPPKLSPSSQLKAPAAMVSGSISDIASGSSPEIGLTGVESGGADSKRASESGRRRGDAWSLLGAEGPSVDREPYSCQCSSEDSPPPQHKAWPAPTQHRRHRRTTKPWHSRQTSSSSRDVSPWDEEPLPRDPLPHTRTYHRDRHESGGSRERRDSAGSRERRDSGSGRDRERERERHRRQSRHSRDDDDDWSGDGGYSRRPGSREARRERGWPQHEDRRRPDELGYSTVGRREGRRRGEPPWQVDEAAHRYTSTMGNRGWRRSGSSGEGGERRPTAERVRSARHHRPSPRSHRSPFPDRSPSPTSARSTRHRDRFFDDFNQSEMDSPIVTKNGNRFRFSNDFSEKDSPRSQTSPFENDFVENVVSVSKKSSLKYDSGSKYDSTSKYETTAKYDGPPKYESTAKYDGPPKYESTAKYDSASKYESTAKYDGPSKYESTAKYDGPPKYESTGKYDGPPKYESTAKYDSASKYESTAKYDGPSKYESTLKYDGMPKYESTAKYDGAYANLEKESPLSARMTNFRFRYDKDISSECMSGSPASPRPRHTSSPPPTARSLFEDDFSPEPRNGILRTTDTNGDHSRKETIHEGEELQVGTARDEKTEKMVGFDFGSGKEGSGIPENRRSQKHNKNRPKMEMDNIKKSESVNIFARETDPFDDDDFFCTASDRPRKDNWQASFDNM